MMCKTFLQTPLGPNMMTFTRAGAVDAINNFIKFKALFRDDADRNTIQENFDHFTTEGMNYIRMRVHYESVMHDGVQRHILIDSRPIELDTKNF